MQYGLSTLALALGFVVSGCVVDDQPQPIVVSGDGLLTVNWTVDGTTDPGACTAEGADVIDVTIETPSGTVFTETSDDCRAGTTSIDLPPGSYYADAVLLDRGGHVITTSIDLGRVTLHGDDELIVNADFPADSFY